LGYPKKLSVIIGPKSIAPTLREVLKMNKSIGCRDMGTDCDFVACGKTVEEVMQKGAEHARTHHNMNEIPKELQDKARLVIRDVESC
jgi:predicted small metal-binding protein